MRKIHFITGGTTRSARLVSYDSDRWERSISVKAKLLSRIGINEHSRVVVCHPFSPWSIGQVHVEGVLRCGGDVYPFGLNCLTSEIMRFMAEAKPTHFCGGTHFLMRIAQVAKEQGFNIELPSGGCLIVAGERLTVANRNECEVMWGAPLVDMYGMAEFDAIGCELPDQQGIALCSDFEYALAKDGTVLSLARGALGELLIRNPGEDSWHSTGDLVGTLNMIDTEDGFTACIEMLGRADLTVNFSDGSAISEIQVSNLIQRFPWVKSIQLQVFRRTDGDIIRAVCLPTEWRFDLDFPALRDAILNINVDVADCYQQGVIRDCIVDVLPRKHAFYTTPRGKQPLIYMAD